MAHILKYLPDPIKWFDDMRGISQHGTGVMLTWVKCTAWDGATVELLLRKYGILVYGRQYAYGDGDDYGVRVRTAQAGWAEYIMLRAGVPLTSPLFDESNRNVIPNDEMPVEWGVPARAAGILGTMTDVMAGGVQSTPKAKGKAQGTQQQRRAGGSILGGIGRFFKDPLDW